MRQKNDGFPYNLVNMYVTRKKNLGFWTKCGFEINKEIKENKAKK